MTEQEERTAIRRALLQAAQADFDAIQGASPPPLSLSYHRWERRFLQDPLTYVKKRTRPLGQRILRTAACFLLLAGLSFACFMAVSPQARAAVSQWYSQWFEDRVSFVFQGESASSSLPVWGIASLPQGYQEEAFLDQANLCIHRYGNGDPEQDIELAYQRLAEGSGFDLDHEFHTVSAVSVLDLDGYLFTPTNNSPCMLLWFDPSSGYSFLLTARLPGETLLDMAESLVLEEEN